MKVCLDSLLQCLVLIMTEGLDSLLQCLVLIMPDSDDHGRECLRAAFQKHDSLAGGEKEKDAIDPMMLYEGNILVRFRYNLSRSHP